MPYVEGFGTWPFGEEWLWEATATSYVPLLRVLDEFGPDESRAKLTLSLTPVLCDQLEAPGAIERCIAFLREIRPESHRRDIEGFRQAGDTGCGRGTGTLGRRVCSRRRHARAASTGRRPAAGTRPACELDLRGDARDPAAAGTRRLDRAAAASRHRLVPATLRGVGRRLLAAGVRVRAMAERDAARGWDPRHLRRADRTPRPRRRAEPASSQASRRPDAVADRPCRHRPRLGRRRLPVASRVPRLPPPHAPRPSRVGQ